MNRPVLARVRPILEPGRTCWVTSPVQDSGLLIDGRDYFRAFHEAARTARRYILLAGWQFDSTVSLLRGRDAEQAGEVRLLKFLNGLCRENPSLRICILCWDYSPAYMLHREWLQDILFNWTTRRGLAFRFDDRHAIGASHHQKFAVVDGAIGFVGSMDFCHERWDRRDHPLDCPDRCEPKDEDTYGPYHEVQAYLTGPAVLDLVELFVARWRTSGGGDLVLPPPSEDVPVRLRPSVRIGAGDVGFSRTMARTLVPNQPSIREIEKLYTDAIDSAEESIYIENQYFGSRSVYQALTRRLADDSRPKLNVVLVYPRELHSFTEELSMGRSQSAMFRYLKSLAARTGHSLGIYCSVSRAEGGAEKPRYIHSKVITVDDRFLTVGSANTNNRSMGLDTELNVSWEAHPDGEPGLRASVRRVRVSLLAEHAGVRTREDLRQLYPAAGLVERLDRMTTDPRLTLRLHPMSSTLDDSPILEALEAEGLSFDPDRPLEEEEVFEPIAPTRKEILAAGFRRFRRVFSWRRRSRISVAVNPPVLIARFPQPVWQAVVQTLRRIGPFFLAVAAGSLLLWALVALARAVVGSG